MPAIQRKKLLWGVSKIWTGYSAFNFLVDLKVIMLACPFLFLWCVCVGGWMGVYACMHACMCLHAHESTYAGQRSMSIFQCLPQLFSILLAEPGAQ